MAPPPRHPTWTQSYIERAMLPHTSPLTAYLLRLIAIKRTNLCLSADVATTAQLLDLAEEVGDSICLLKTHADTLSDFSDRTVRGLREIAKRKKFLVFEDRKFADIGETVQKQYTSGPLVIARWAEITNAHVLPGPAIVSSLKEAATGAIHTYNQSVHTEISAEPVNGTGTVSDSTTLEVDGDDNDSADSRKQSIVSISTTISQSISPQPTPMIEGEGEMYDAADILEQLGSTPFLRALLLIAEMSSAGNLLNESYAERSVEIAREHKDFVMGFIAQRSLNSEPEDNFLTMTPGVKLPPKGQDGAVTGDGKGQQYNSPRHIIYEKGCDVAIVGRGIVQADNRAEEAERYRRESWAAYEERIAK
ncbi:Orotidine 5'-phosphate decarboxylase domain-containing protein [Phyllosticta citriasiana]|uniref:Orotidine 5'-phosphate decarboxylase n=1 Tax=Phyllosticta citriasiana TaxID=595635 RepID=A0ABR1KQ87_9PEZI